MPSLLLAAIFFAGIHLGIAGTTVRDRATAALGESAYMIAFSLASVVGLAWIVAAYNRAPYIATWGMLEWWKPFAIISMLPASLLVVIGLTTPNPTSVAQEGRLAQPEPISPGSNRCKRYDGGLCRERLPGGTQKTPALSIDRHGTGESYDCPSRKKDERGDVAVTDQMH